MKHTIRLLLTFIMPVAVFGASHAHAQMCGVGYDRDDRERVIRPVSAASPLFERLQRLANISAAGVMSVADRDLMQIQFDAARSELTRLGDRRRFGLSARSNQFLGQIIDADYLGLSGLTITGSSIAEAQANSRAAVDALNLAWSTLLECLVGSWERVNVVLSTNDGMCAGGYDRMDRAQVRRVASSLERPLQAIERLAQQGAYEATAVTQRHLMNFELEYQKEEIELLGTTPRGRLHARTINFLRAFVDPGFLGLADGTVDGNTVDEAQRHALALLEALNGARTLVQQCMAR